MKLEKGTILALYNSQKTNPLFKNPVVQLLSPTKVGMASDSKPRYKANISDGQYYMKAVFTTEVSAQLHSGQIKNNDIIKIGQFSIRPKDVHLYVYIQNIIQIESTKSEIGNPVSISIGAQPVVAPHPNVTPQKTKQADDPVKRTSISSNIVPIKEINPFLNKWIIKGRVVSKSDIRKFNSKNGEGKLFSFEIADSSMQCKVVAFSDAVDIFYPLIENNKVFSISSGTVKMANKQYSSNNFDYEIHLETNSDVQPVEDDEIPMFNFTFQQIGQLSMSKSIVDVIGIVKEVYPVSTIVAKTTGKELTKREIILIDQTGNCRLTLWGAKAEEEFEKESVLCCKSVKVGEYNGINLSSVSGSQIVSNIDIPEAVELLSWYQREGKGIVVQRPKSNPKTTVLSELKEGNQEYGFMNGTIIYLKEDSLFYESCPSDNCNKKVTLEDNGTYRCEKCNYTYDKCDYRYMISFSCGDFTDLSWIVGFDEVGKKLFGISAEGMKKLKDDSPQDVQAFVKGVIGQDFTFKLRIKEEMYNNEMTKRITCSDVNPIDIASQTKKMLDAMEKVCINK